jgi:hypothetical protein
VEALGIESGDTSGQARRLACMSNVVALDANRTDRKLFRKLRRSTCPVSRQVGAVRAFSFDEDLAWVGFIGANRSCNGARKRKDADGTRSRIAA